MYRLLLLLLLLGALAGTACAGPRQVMSLDGVWQLAEGSMEAPTSDFSTTVPVPGLVDMADPYLPDVGVEASTHRREAFWYRRTFNLPGAVPEIALLKVNKACYTTRVFLNGQLIGDHIGSFTPGWFDLKPALKGEGAENELLIRVGAWRNSVPLGVPDGNDFERIKYIPGIYDSVQLILTGSPYIVRAQVVPELESNSARVVAVVKNVGGARSVTLKARIREAKSERTVGLLEPQLVQLAQGEERTFDFIVPIRDCSLWTPEEPFLYKLELSTGADEYSTRFGMRTFAFDREQGCALLNGKPYPLRGTNVCIFRFFEDPLREGKPWDADWVRKLHEGFRSMHWNSIRYCIGFPPESWYDIADEVGLLLQDEYPIWGINLPESITLEALAQEYTEWIEERWNHPSVAIWDAQNETVSEVTGQAIAAVRHLDLSDRPWDNGWSPPDRPTDAFEAHPYAFINSAFDMAAFERLPGGPEPGGLSGNPIPYNGNPVIINEYGWLWLNRDATLTGISQGYGIYDRFLGPDSTADQRRVLYARLLAAKTEFWRAKREVAGVLHFCGLGYSRPGGATSDNFIDIEQLEFDPYFWRYVRDAFAPVGLMVDFWRGEAQGGKRQVKVWVTNDLPTEWKGEVTLSLLSGEKVLFTQKKLLKVAPWQASPFAFTVDFPKAPGKYQLVATLPGGEGEPVRSLRDFAVLTEAEQFDKHGFAEGATATASSAIFISDQHYPARYAVDGDSTTRWSSEFADPQWLELDLGKPQTFSRVELLWEIACGKAYALSVSDEGAAWKQVFATSASPGGLEKISFAPVTARKLRFDFTERATRFGYSLWEVKVLP